MEINYFRVNLPYRLIFNSVVVTAACFEIAGAFQTAISQQAGKRLTAHVISSIILMVMDYKV